jgi:hypothetical protein
MQPVCIDLIRKSKAARIAGIAARRLPMTVPAWRGPALCNRRSRANIPDVANTSTREELKNGFNHHGCDGPASTEAVLQWRVS